MLDISKISYNNTEYNIVDAGGRELIEALGIPTSYLGITTTSLTDGATTNPIIVNGKNITAKAGGTVFVQGDTNKEFIFNGSSWQEFGDTVVDNRTIEKNINNQLQLKSTWESGLQQALDSKVSGYIDDSHNLILTTNNTSVNSALYNQVDVSFTAAISNYTITLSNLSGTWQNGNSATLSIPEALDIDNLSPNKAYAIFTLNSNYSITTTLIKAANPDINWGTNYIEIDPEEGANYELTLSFDKVGNLQNLITTEKRTLVGAINEIKASGSGGGGSSIVYTGTDGISVTGTTISGGELKNIIGTGSLSTTANTIIPAINEINNVVGQANAALETLISSGV